MKHVPIPNIPEPRLRVVENLTPFTTFQCDKMGCGRRFFDTVVVKGTFDLTPGILKVASVQAPVTLADDYWDLVTPERSSVKHAGEVVLVKPSTDFIVTGTVRPYAGRPLREWDTTVAVKGRRGTLLDYGVRVTGARHWRHSSVLGWGLTDPEATGGVPIRYELAYGGAYIDIRHGATEGTENRWVLYRPNPSGTGFFDEKNLDRGAIYRAPQWQPRYQPITAINRELPLSGFGPIARPWSARLKYAGTYDDAWHRTARLDIQNGHPADYAADFDAHFFQCAHPSLVTAEYLQGDEHVCLNGMTQEQTQLVARLPGLLVRARLLDGRNQWCEELMPLDTVHFDLDSAAVYLCWRLSLSQERDVRVAVIFTQEAT